MRKHAKFAEFARNLPDLREICAEFARNLRKFAQIVFATFTQICAKFTAPFVTVPFVPFRPTHLCKAVWQSARAAHSAPESCHQTMGVRHERGHAHEVAQSSFRTNEAAGQETNMA